MKDVLNNAQKATVGIIIALLIVTSINAKKIKKGDCQIGPSEKRQTNEVGDYDSNLCKGEEVMCCYLIRQDGELANNLVLKYLE